MKIVVNFQFPIEPFNTMLREGTAGKTIESVMAEIKPEALYFYAPNGCRGGTMVVNLDSASQIPSVAEPLFLKFEAKCEFHVAMTPDDLARSGLGEIGKRWR